MRSYVNVGEVLAGKYRVDRILGVGGMGMVVAATHLDLGQGVALKFMLPEALDSPRAIDRFLREARAAVRLQSEHVCRVLDVGRLDSGAPYIVMELLAGLDLAQVLKRRGPLPAAETVDYVLQALEGLAEAHGNGIVHRDLKPANLFVTTTNDGSPLVKVLDFGISKSSLGNATRTGDVMGTPAYMAPEQMASSKDVDARADVWAVGVIAYEALAGRIPFEGETLPAIVMAVMNGDVRPLAQLRRDLPPGLAAVIMRCLEYQPAARFATVADLAAALAPFGPPTSAELAVRIAKVLRRSGPLPELAPSAPETATPTTLQGAVTTVPAKRSTRPARGWWVALAAAIVVGGVIGALAVVRSKDSPTTVAATTLPPPAPSPPPPVPADAAAPDPAPAAVPPIDAPLAPIDAEPADAAPADAELASPGRSVPAKHHRAKTSKSSTKQPASSAAPEPEEPEESDLPVALDKPMIERWVVAALTRAHSCTERLSLKGSTIAHVTVAPDGSITEVTAEPADDALARCVASMLRTVPFPPTQKGGRFSKMFTLQ